MPHLLPGAQAELLEAQAARDKAVGQVSLRIYTCRRLRAHRLARTIMCYAFNAGPCR